ncbi:integrase catalytic domain-containing protein [Trichonephila inaurata madagascariensis]|uniref:Integrase catalytic domain-containing protein n=1 Tax=Trichonephila inaurata madagascariensis TaxID=2747483 RepID=A0A8X7CIV3_9ARAC|nr:integrase catalytic domain-containing protein [Trichonephila inaurata madagascariensis]
MREYLYAGPPLNPRIDVILRFREYEHAFCSVIQGAFLTIGIAEEDRDYLRFFWLPNDGDAKSYKIMGMNRVPFGVTLSLFELAATIKFHIRKYKEDYRETFEMLNTSLYVDDLFAGSSESVNKAFDLSKNAIEILKDANMNLRKFKTNSKELRKLWNENGIGDVGESGERSLKVLGIIWNLNNDTFKLDSQPLLELIKNLKNSKRCVLKTAAKMFDPIGFISPFVLIIKCLMQEIWEYGLGWDEQLPTELKNKWETWCSQVCLLNQCSATPDKGKDLQLHIFCDASPRAFGTVAYFRYVTANDDIYTRFITAKSRVSPLKKLTLPRLELLGAVLASRILKHLTSKFKFPISKFFLWSDSSIALHWINAKASNYKQFVSNRVIEIQSNSDPSDWHHCSGRENPADYVSRGANLETIINSQFWLHGPQRLRKTENNWPKNLNCDFSSTDPYKSEEQVFTFACELNTASVINLSKFSNLQKLLRVTSWVLRFVHNIRNRFNKRSDELTTTEEIDGTEKFWIQLVQRDAFAKEVNSLRRFISRRGLCSKILTDNARTFKRSEIELKNLWKVISDPTVKAFYASHKIYWQFIIERAPWWGGFYEILIRTVKLALRKTMGRTTLFGDELETLLIEIEGVLNSRPLTNIFSEFNESEPLTPSHMILGRRVNSLPPARLNFDSNLSNRKILIKRFNYRERLFNMFWTKWSKEYIFRLNSAHCVKPTGEIKEFKIDDVVLINDKKFPRHFWKLGKVVDVFPGMDGKIRSCKIKTQNSIIKRPVQLLHNLELNE